ncbi:MAG: signal peptidase I [Acidimicrobiales bacterium]
MAIATLVAPTHRPVAEEAAPPATTDRAPVRSVLSVLGTIATALVAALASVSVVIAVATHFSPKGEYVVFGHPVMSMISGSMAGTINTGDLVVDRSLSPAQATQLHVGQVITFRSAPGSERLFTHRIVAVTHPQSGTVTYVTKGDANNAPDTGTVSPSEVVGLYQTRIPSGGYVLNVLRSPLALLGLALIPLLLVFGGPLWRWARDSDAAERRRIAARSLEALEAARGKS